MTQQSQAWKNGIFIADDTLYAFIEYDFLHLGLFFIFFYFFIDNKSALVGCNDLVPNTGQAIAEAMMINPCVAGPLRVNIVISLRKNKFDGVGWARHMEVSDRDTEYVNSCLFFNIIKSTVLHQIQYLHYLLIWLSPQWYGKTTAVHYAMTAPRRHIHTKQRAVLSWLYFALRWNAVSMINVGLNAALKSMGNDYLSKYSWRFRFSLS